MSTRLPESDEVRWEEWRNLRKRQEEATTAEELRVLAEEEEALRLKGVRDLLVKDIMAEKQWFWLSFADETGFLGVAIVHAGGIMEATIIAREGGYNPGGEVQAYPLPEPPAKHLRNRLLSEEELREEGLI